MPQTTKIKDHRDGPQVHHPQRRQHGRRAAPTEPQTSLKRLTALPHAVAVTRICARKDGGVYSTASDGRVCLTNDTGRPSLKFGQRGSIEVDGWQHDLDLVEDQLLLGAGALATKAWDAQTGAQVASLQGSPRRHAMRERLHQVEWRRAATTASVGCRTYREKTRPASRN